MTDGAKMTRGAPAHQGRREATATATDLAARLAALPGLAHEELRSEWRRLYRAHPPKSLSRDLLELGVAWKLQEPAFRVG